MSEESSSRNVGSSSRPNGKKTPILIGVAGATASGKSSVCAEIMKRLGNLTIQEALQAQHGNFNFDHPDAFEDHLMLETLQSLKNGHSVRIPKYDYVKNTRIPGEFIDISPVDVVLVEGILVFYYPEIRDMFNMKLFVDTDPDTRLARRVLRDTKERGRSLEHTLKQYLNLVKPAYEDFCLPTKKYADVIIPRGSANSVAIDLIVQHIMGFLKSPRASPVAVSNGISRETLTEDLVNGDARELDQIPKQTKKEESYKVS